MMYWPGIAHPLPELPRGPPITHSVSTTTAIKQLAPTDIPVVNLSNKPLSPVHLSVLSKGLSFVPTARYNYFDTRVDIYKFIRKLRLRLYFKDHTPSEQDISRLRPPSTFMPPGATDSAIETYSKLVHRDLDELERNIPFVKHNLTQLEKRALSELQNDSTIVIRSADKGGAVVIQDIDQYEAEVLRQLNDTTFYKRLSNDPTKVTRAQIKRVVDNAKKTGSISNSDHRFLLRNSSTMPSFYTLPKIHKNISPCPGRPIVSGNGSLLEPLSQFVDYHIKSFVQSLPSYIRDSSDLITKLRSLDLDLPHSILASFDIESLYSNIPQEAALGVLTDTLTASRRQIQPPNEFILHLANLTLSNNYFRYGKNNYLQIKGVAMGSSMAPNVANLYVGSFEHNTVFNSTLNRFLPSIKAWFRYIDDVFLIWEGSADSLIEFHSLLNSWDSNLKFTFEYSPTQIHFLDLLIYKADDVLATTLYTKDTDRNTLLLSSSYHPKSLKENLPVGQFFRLRRLCSDRNDFIQQAHSMKYRFSERGYSQRTIRSAYKRALYSNRDTLLEPRQKQKTEHIVCSLRYSPLSNKTKRVLLRHWHVLQIHDSFTNKPLVALRRNSNLRDKLVHTSQDRTAKQPTIDSLPPPSGHYPCAHCACCPLSSKIKSFINPSTNVEITLRSLTTCASEGVIYAIRCECPLIYVGKTSRCLRIRITEHKSSIKRKDIHSPLAIHCTQKGHMMHSLRFWAIEKVDRNPRGGDYEKLLLQRETMWIHRLNCIAPFGLNEQLDFSCFL